jgi:hypothetical protein
MTVVHIGAQPLQDLLIDWPECVLGVGANYRVKLCLSGLEHVILVEINR